MADFYVLKMSDNGLYSGTLLVIKSQIGSTDIAEELDQIKNQLNNGEIYYSHYGYAIVKMLNDNMENAFEKASESNPTQLAPMID